MKRLLMIPVLAFSLAGCAGLPGGGTGTLPPAVTDAIGQIQAATKQACSYQPTVETIANLLSAIGVPYVGMVSTVSNQICSVVTKFGAGRGGKRMMAVRSEVTGKVKSVEIKGQFVR